MMNVRNYREKQKQRVHTSVEEKLNLQGTMRSRASPNAREDLSKLSKDELISKHSL